jgi:hypothetical protein
VGNVVRANEEFRPGKDAPMTLAQMTAAQKAVDAGAAPVQDRGLSPETVAGLQAIRAASDQARSNMEPVQKPQPIAEEKKPAADAAVKKDVVAAVDRLDDLEFERMLRGMQEDVINNTRERDAIKARVEPIDFEKGLASGEFEQWVPIVPERFKVLFRTVSAMENQYIRLWLFNWADSDPRIEKLAAEVYSLALVVAAVKQINGNAMPPHLKGNTAYDFEFDEDAFKKKYHVVSTYPLPLIHSLGVHSAWFDQRVRELFTSEHLKNG